LLIHSYSSLGANELIRLRFSSYVKALYNDYRSMPESASAAILHVSGCQHNDITGQTIIDNTAR